MRIVVKRSGGYAGLTETLADLDTSRLDAARARRLEELVTGLDFFKLPETIQTETVGADFLRYEVTVIHGARRHEIAFVDDDTPATRKLRQMITTVASLA